MVQHLNPADEPLARRSYAPHFAVLALALLGVTAWAVWDEAVAKRPWKAYQRSFLAEAEQKYRADLETARKELEAARQTEEYASARAEYEAVRQAHDSPEARAERTRLESELAKVSADLDAVRHRFQILRGSYQEAVYRFEHTRSDRWRSRLVGMEPEVARLSMRMTELQEQRKALLEKLRSPEEKLQTARARFVRFEERVHELQRALAAVRQERVEIRQAVNAKLNLVDRCTSCHMGTTRPGLQGLTQPFATHPPVYLRRDDNGKSARDILKDHPLETFGCVSCHRGQGYATASVREAHGEVEFWLTPLLRGRQVWGSCQKCHDTQPDVAGMESGWEGRRLVAAYGCYACHKVPGFEQEAAVRIGPNLNVLSKKVYPGWVPLWLKNPRTYRPTTRMPNMLLSDAERRAISAYLLQAGGNAVEDGVRVQASLADVAAGKELFETVGCLGCHSVNGRGSKFAPDLTRVGEKVRPEYLAEWLRDPVKLQPGASMPNLRLSATETRQLAAYLSTLTEAPLPPVDFDPRDTDLAVRGKALIIRYNCFGCHRIPGLEGRPSLVPELATIGSKLVEEFDFGLKRKQILASAKLENERENVQQARFAWIVRKLKAPRGFDEGRYKKPDESLRMPDFSLSDVEATDISTYLSGLTGETAPAEFREPLSERASAMAAGAELIRKYNCTGCHQFDAERVVLRDGTLLEGAVKLREDDAIFFQLWRDSPALGRKASEIVPVAEKDILTRSPASGGEIVPFVVERALAAEGLSLEQVQQDPAALVKAEEGRAFAPPVLFGEGRKVRPVWLFRFLTRPVALRPWLRVRMPTFPLAPEEAQTLAKYFAAVDQQPFPFELEEDRDAEVLAARETAAPGYFARAQRLFSHSDVKCASCHLRGVIKPEGDPSGWAPDLALAAERLRPAWIAAWLTNPQWLQPGTKMPTFFPEGDSRYQDVFPGTAERQIQALRDYVLSISLRTASARGVIAGGRP